MTALPTRLLKIGTLLSCAIAIFLIGLLHSEKIPLMGDELTTYYLGTLPTLQSLYESLQNGADSHGPFPHLINHLWLKHDSNPQIWGRLPSILLWIATIFLLTHLLQKRLPFAMSLCLCLSLLLWPETHRHLAEIRSYGWVVFLLSCQIWAVTELYARPQAKTLLLLALFSALSFLTHPMAVAYSGASVLLAAIASYKTPLRQRLLPPLAWGLGSLALAPWVPSLIGQTQSTMSDSVRWASPPEPHLLWQLAHPNLCLVALGGLFLVISFSASFLSSWLTSPWLTSPKAAAARPPAKPQQTDHVSIPTLWMAIGSGLALLPLAFWVVSQTTNPLFTERYILPSQIGWILLLGGILSTRKNLDSELPNALAFLSIPLLLGAAAAFPLLPRDTTGGFSNSNNPWADIGIQETKYFTEPLPVACESSTTYLPRHFYLSEKHSYHLLLPAQSQGVRKMDAIMNKALGQEDPRQSIDPVSSFLTAHKKFYLINEPQNPLDKEIPAQYHRTPLTTPTNPASLRLELVELLDPPTHHEPE